MQLGYLIFLNIFYFMLFLNIYLNLIDLLLQFYRQYINNMITPLSAKNKPKSNQKSHTISTSRFFKKPTQDQNQKNCINYLQKIIANKNMSKGICSTSGTITPLASINIIKKNQSNKKSTLNLASKQLKTQADTSVNKQNEIKLIKKDRSVKNLKLTGSIEFPKILTKSISQTTMNKKIDQAKLKMFDKIGIRKKIQKYQKIDKFQKKPNIQFQHIKLSQFRLGKKLGSGRFGNVYIAQDKQTKLVYAIKVMNKQKIKQAEMQQQIVQQIKLQTYMNHPNILKLFGFFHDAKNIYLILQYCSQCLFKDLRNKSKFSEQETAYYVKQAISSLKYMHNQNIIHRDIKPQNILIENDVLKMSDFGWSTYAPVYKRQTFCGTVDYVPPEIVQGNTYDQRVDIWAIGVLLYQLASGCAPFQTKDQNITYQKIVKSDCKFPSHFSSNFKNLINKILSKNPSKRPNFDQIQNDIWFQKYKTTGRYISKQIWAAWNSL